MGRRLYRQEFDGVEMTTPSFVPGPNDHHMLVLIDATVSTGTVYLTLGQGQGLPLEDNGAPLRHIWEVQTYFLGAVAPTFIRAFEVGGREAINVAAVFDWSAGVTLQCFDSLTDEPAPIPAGAIVEVWAL